MRMPELRKDYVLDRYVIIATGRAKRPQQDADEEKADNKKACFFCPGHEAETPPDIYRVDKKGSWKIRVFNNKFPAVQTDGPQELVTDNNYYTYAGAVGRHEIVVETPDHNKQLAELSAKDLRDVLDVYSKRITELSAVPYVKYVSVYKNQGEEAGCSIAHSHTQILAYNLIPQIIREKERACSDSGNCPYCRIILAEKDSERRVFEDENIAAFTPYASRFPYETWIMPKRHVLRLEELNDSEMLSMAKALRLTLRKLKKLNAPYNFYFHYGIEKLHLQLIITPRFTKAKWAGFELSTGTIINIVSPEKAAEFYRK